MSRDRVWLRPLAGAAILAVLVWRLGTGPFVDAVRAIDPWSIGAAAAIAAVTTVCGAWRWVLVARGLGVDLSLGAAVGECYRSQFLNVTLPGGVVGDVRRGVRHGRGAGDLGRGLRSVVWERSAGQVVLGVVTLGALLLLPSPLRIGPTGAGSSGPDGSAAGAGGPAPEGVAGLVALIVVLALLALLAVGAVLTTFFGARRGAGRRGGTRLPVRVARAAVGDVRAGLLGRHTWPGVLAASGVVVSGHVATFLVAARAAGVTAPLLGLAPLALIVLVAMGLPLNLAGWGPREGAAAWVFGAAGLGASVGVGTAVVYGVLVLVASLPGAVLLVTSSRRVRTAARSGSARVVVLEGGSHG